MQCDLHQVSDGHEALEIVKLGVDPLGIEEPAGVREHEEPRQEGPDGVRQETIDVVFCSMCGYWRQTRASHVSGLEEVQVKEQAWQECLATEYSTAAIDKYSSHEKGMLSVSPKKEGIVSERLQVPVSQSAGTGVRMRMERNNLRSRNIQQELLYTDW